jgi:hypothetical protein
MILLVQSHVVIIELSHYNRVEEGILDRKLIILRE